MPEDRATSREYDCLVISDLHLGSEICQAKLLESFLEWAAEHSRVLVLDGDVFDDLNFTRLKKSHFACLRSIRRHSDRDDFRVIWVRGNHDGSADVVSHIVGVEVHDEYEFRNEQVGLLILHGDQFDRFVSHYGWLTEVACSLFYFLSRWAPHRASRWIRRISKRWQRNSQRVMQGAVEYAHNKGYHHVTCGHTHFPLEAELSGVHYLNSGTWIEPPPCPFVSVKGNQVRLEYWPRPDMQLPAAGQAEAEAEEAPATAPQDADSPGRFDDPGALHRVASEAPGEPRG